MADVEKKVAVENLATTWVEREEIFKITLCGSTRFRAEYELWNKRLTLAGFLVYSVSGFGHSGDTFTDEEKVRLDEVHLAKIDASHAIVVVGDGYVGASTRREIEHALLAGKAVYATSPGGLDLPEALSRRVAFVYNLRTGPAGAGSLRYRAFDYEDTGSSALIERVKVLEGALAGIADDFMTSEKHHPDHVLIPKAKFEQLCEFSALSNATGGEGYGVPSQPRSDGTVARLNIDAEPSGAEEPRSAFEVGKPAPYYCKACEAVPQAGYCKMEGCPTAPEVVEAKHTPGPWEVLVSSGTNYVLARDADDEPWTICYAIAPALPGSCVAANAHLIAKAPDMLAELKRCLMGCGDRERIANLIAEAEGK